MAIPFWAVHNAAPASSRAAIPGLLAYARVLLCWLLSAGVYIAVKWAAADMPPWTLAFWRPLLAALILLPLVVRHRRAMARLLRARGALVLLIGGLGLAISQGMIYARLRDTTAVNAGLIMALMPMLTLFLAWAMLSEALRVSQVIGTLVALAGLVVIVVRGQISALLGLELSRGDMWIAGSALCFALYGVLLRKARFDLPRLPLLVLLLGSGAVAAVPFYASELWRGEWARMNASGLFSLAYVAIPGGALMYYLHNASVDDFGPSRAGVFLYLQPFFIGVLAWIFLGERLAGYDYAGGALIVIGVMLVTVLGAKSFRSSR